GLGGASLLLFGIFMIHILVARTDWGRQKLDYPDIPQQIELLRSGNRADRAQAAFVLGVEGDERASDPLRQALADDDAEVREMAALALCRLSDERVLLRAVPQAEADVKHSIEAVLRKSNIAVDKLLERAALDPDPHVCSGAVEAIVDRGPEAGPVLV